MTLYQKFLELAFAKITSESLAKKCVIVTDNFSICFAEWFESTVRQSDNLRDRFSMSELLEMYKKECEEMINRKYK